LLRYSPLLALTSLCSAQLYAQTQISGYSELRAATSSAAQSWQSGGSGALGTGDGLHAETRLGLSFAPASSRWFFSLSALARADQDGNNGRNIGLLDAFVDYGDLGSDGFRVRAGQAFAGTSRENIEAFWQTPYMLDLSALNSWIGEEFRPIGVEFSKRFTNKDSGQFDLSASFYGGNDSGPALLAWRGFAIHNRLSVYGETLPLLPLPSLRAADQFGAQRRDGTQPFSADLDGRVGYALRGRYASGSDTNLSVLLSDNRGDRDLHRGNEYAWATRFVVLGFDHALSSEWTVLGEVLRGRTQMGFAPGANVSFGFNAAYVLLSRRVDAWTISARLESFHIDERDNSIGELNRQNGQSAAFALLREWGDWRFGAQWQTAQIRRPGNAEFSGDPAQGGTQFTLLARYYFEAN